MNAVETERYNVGVLEKSTWMPRAQSGTSCYLAGRCYEFALALATFLPSAQPMAIMDGPVPDHAGLMLQDGRFVDIRGLCADSRAFATGFRSDLGLPQGVAWDVLVEECDIGAALDPWRDVPAMAQALADVTKRFPGLRPVP